MTIALAAAVVALVALLAYREWGARRERLEARADRLESAATLARSRAETAAERDRAAQERRELYQRIQAPEIAVAEQLRADRSGRRKARPIAADDDAAFLARKNGDG